MKWIELTSSAEMPKLGWLIRALTASKVLFRLNGDSFKDPTLEVEETYLPFAQRIWHPIEALPNDDPMFENTLNARAWWVEAEKVNPGQLTAAIGIVAGALGLMAYRVRSRIAEDVSCAPEGHTAIRCPLEAGLIKECPADYWPVCRPLTRVESFLVNVSEANGAKSEAVIAMTRQLFAAADRKQETVPIVNMLLAMSQQIANWITEDGAKKILDLIDKTPSEIVNLIQSEVVVMNGTAYPKKIDVEINDVTN